eukprot:2513422-Rhodomonas_salina.3
MSGSDTVFGATREHPGYPPGPESSVHAVAHFPPDVAVQVAFRLSCDVCAMRRPELTPRCSSRLLWDVIMMTLLVYCLLSVPVHSAICFQMHQELPWTETVCDVPRSCSHSSRTRHHRKRSAALVSSIPKYGPTHALGDVQD